MKKIGLLVREDIISEVNDRASDISGCFFFSFNKVNASSFNRLRNDLRNTEARVFVAKNNLLQRAFDKLGWEDGESLSGTETAMVFSYGADVVNVCKVLVGFSKENEFFQIKGGILKDKKVDSKEITALSKLPPREVVLGMALGAIASPLTGFLGALNQVIQKFVWAIEEVKKTKEQK